MKEKMDELLAKYMLGEATGEEVRVMDEWVKTTGANLKYFTHFKLIWETAGKLRTESKLDVEDSWAEFKQLAHNKQSSTTIKPMHGATRWLKIAAVWLVIFGAAGILYKVSEPATPRMLTAQTINRIKTDTLSDGSVVTLNKNSLISYPEEFADNIREITLTKGEAFFDISPNKAKPFLIHINDAVVKVVGTSFNIKIGDEKAEVIVESGMVQVIKQKVVIHLQPKETVEIDRRSNSMKKGVSSDRLYNYYRTNQLVASKTPLWRVVQVLNEAYNVNIVIPDKGIANRPLSTTLIMGSLEENLTIIKQTLDLQTTLKGNKIFIQ